MFFYALLILLAVFGNIANAQSSSFQICHGYDCYYKTKLNLNKSDQNRIAQIMRKSAKSPKDERAAIRTAIAYFEERSTQVIGIRDDARMEFGKGRRRGQMDCVDESLNTTNFLNYLANNNLLNYHKIGRRDSRGFFLDGRYPHWTAVIIDQENRKWAVDSWYEAGGGKPDVMLLNEWKKRGINGAR